MARIKVSVKTVADLQDVANRANGELGKAYDAMLEPGDYGRFEFTGSGDLRLIGVDPNRTAVFGSVKWAAFHVWDATRFRGAANISVDGGGVSQWGLVLGSAYKGQGRGPVTGAKFSNLDVGHVGQECVKVAGSSSRCEFDGLQVHHSGMSGSWGELIYVGQGGDLSDRPKNIVFSNVKGWHGRNGEAFDVKTGAQYVRLTDFEFTDIVLPYSGALTIGIDNNDGGHGEETGHVIERGYVSDIRRGGSYAAHGAQIGTDCVLRDIHFEDIDGYAVDVVSQFAGPSKTVVLEGVTAKRSGGMLADNVHAPHGGVSRGTILGSVDRPQVPEPELGLAATVAGLVEGHGAEAVAAEALSGLSRAELWAAVGNIVLG